MMPDVQIDMHGAGKARDTTLDDEK